MSCSDAAPSSGISGSNIDISGESSTRGKLRTWCLSQEATPSHRPCPDRCLQQHSAVSSPCSSQTSRTAFLSTSALVFRVLAPLMPRVCLQSALLLLLCSEVPSLQSHPSTCAPCGDPFLCPSFINFPLQGSLSSRGTSTCRVLVPAGEVWRHRGNCSEATHGMAWHVLSVDASPD